MVGESWKKVCQKSSEFPGELAVGLSGYGRLTTSVRLDPFSHIVGLPTSVNMPDVDLAATIQAYMHLDKHLSLLCRSKDLMVPRRKRHQDGVEAAGMSFLYAFGCLSQLHASLQTGGQVVAKGGTGVFTISTKKGKGTVSFDCVPCVCMLGTHGCLSLIKLAILKYEFEPDSHENKRLKGGS